MNANNDFRVLTSEAIGQTRTLSPKYKGKIFLKQYQKRYSECLYLKVWYRYQVPFMNWVWVMRSEEDARLY